MGAEPGVGNTLPRALTCYNIATLIQIQAQPHTLWQKFIALKEVGAKRVGWISRGASLQRIQYCYVCRSAQSSLDMNTTSLITQVSLLPGKLHNISSQLEQCVILMLTKEKDRHHYSNCNSIFCLFPCHLLQHLTGPRKTCTRLCTLADRCVSKNKNKNRQCTFLKDFKLELQVCEMQ